MAGRLTRLFAYFTLLCYLTCVLGLSLGNGMQETNKDVNFYLGNTTDPEKILEYANFLVNGSNAKPNYFLTRAIEIYRTMVKGQTTAGTIRLTKCGTNNCTEDRFQCTDGQWITRNSMCDGNKDCVDGSDEHDCTLRNCTSSRFRCANTGRCVPLSWRCNGADDCHDGSDEAGCTKNEHPNNSNHSSNFSECGPNNCTEDSFQCTNGRWISKSWKCNGVRDCTDGSDELDCAHRTCPLTHFRCANTGRCVPLSWRCDLAEDCLDGSDEAGCTFNATEFFQCNNGHWVRMRYFCDGAKNCKDGSDEHDCLNRDCPPSRFKCADNGICILSSLRCDGARDCHDGSDEAECSPTHL